MNQQDFVNYVLDFYGYRGIYSTHGFTRREVETALDVYLQTKPEFLGDSIDRERVRDVVFTQRGLRVDL